MDGVDPAVAGRDQLPSLREHFDVINAKTTNWCVVPWATEAWATVVHPELEPARRPREAERGARLSASAGRAGRRRGVAGAWRAAPGCRHTARPSNDSTRSGSKGPGTDLTIGLLPTSRFAGGGSTTVDGIQHISNLPTEEVFTAPDPRGPTASSRRRSRST